MKRILDNIMFAGGICAMICACSSENVSTDDSAGNADATAQAIQEILTPSEQPVMMAGGAAGTLSTETDGVSSKASISSDANGNFTATNLGVFMVATDYLTANTSRTPVINWANASKSANITDTYNISHWATIYKNNIDVWSVYYDIHNAAAHVSQATVGATTSTTLTFDDERQRYFPIGNYHRYSFYAYAPRTGMESGIGKAHTSKATVIGYNTDYLTAKIYLDGTQDVIWGKARGTDYNRDCLNETARQTATDERVWHLQQMAYSAALYRQPEAKDENDVSIPVTMDFVHKLAKLKFQVKPGAVNGSYTNALKVYIDTIAIANAPEYITLRLADKSTDTADDGNLDYVNDVSAVYKLTETSDNSYMSTKYMKDIISFNADGTPKPASLGRYIMLPLRSDSDPQYKVMMVMHYYTTTATGNSVRHNARLIYPLDAGMPSTWKAGEEHNMILTVYHPVDVAKFGASLTNWTVDPDYMSLQ